MLDLTMTFEQKVMYANAEDLYARMIQGVEDKMAGMNVKELRQYAASVGANVRGLSVRAHYLGAVRNALMRQCVDDSGYTASRGYMVGRRFDF